MSPGGYMVVFVLYVVEGKWRHRREKNIDQAQGRCVVRVKAAACRNL